VFRYARDLLVVEGALQEASLERVPHWLVDKGEIGCESIECRVPLETIQGEEKDIGGPETADLGDDKALVIDLKALFALVIRRHLSHRGTGVATITVTKK